MSSALVDYLRALSGDIIAGTAERRAGWKVDSVKARKIVHDAHVKAGPAPELTRVYGEYLRAKARKK